MNAWGYDTIEVGEEDLKQLQGLDIVAFQIAEPGAMGYHGGVFFVTSDKKVYSTCYLEPSAYTGNHRGMSYQDLESVFPPLREFDHGLLGYNVVVPDGWHYSYLGCGNHLLVKESLWDPFAKKVAETEAMQTKSYLYNNWLPAIQSIL